MIEHMFGSLESLVKLRKDLEAERTEAADRERSAG